MGVYKNIWITTKVDGNIHDYVEALKEHYHFDDTCIHYKGGSIRDDVMESSGSLEDLMNQDKKGSFTLFQGYGHVSLRLHEKLGEIQYIELSDSVRSYNSWDALYPHLDFAKKVGNSFAMLNNEDFEDSTVIMKAYDKTGKELTGDEAIKYGHDVLGLSVQDWCVSVPSAWIVYDKPMDGDIRDGYVTKVEKDNSAFEADRYCVGYLDPKDNQIHRGVDFRCNRDMGVDMKQFIQEVEKEFAQPKWQGKITEYLAVRKQYKDNIDILLDSQREKLKKKIFDFQVEFEGTVKYLYDKALARTKGIDIHNENAREAGNRMAKKQDMEMDVPFDTVEKKTPYMTLAEAETDWKRWADLKNKTINGKDAAVLMGDAPWRTKEELLAEKKKFISFVPEKSSKEAAVLQRGLDMQDEAKKRFAESTGIKLGEGGIYRSEENPVMIARVQFQDKDGNPIQIMTTGAEFAKLWDDGAPKNVIDEAQWNMALTGAKQAHVGCLIDDRENSGVDGLKFVSVSIKRDDRIIDVLTKEAERFGKELESKFLNMNVSAEMVTKKTLAKGEAYEVKMPENTKLEGCTVVIPSKMVKPQRWGNGYRLNLPVQNLKGKSFLFKVEGNDKVKSASTAQIYCAVNRTRGRELFTNNRSSLARHYKKKKNAELLASKLSDELNY